MTPAYKRLKYACYTTNISMSVVGNLSPLLFVTFHNLYGISYSLLGLLVLINFFTQLSIDLIFSFFSHKFNIPLMVRINPILTVVGLLIYALWPFFFAENIYLGLVIGTVIFACSGGLSEAVAAALREQNIDFEARPVVCDGIEACRVALLKKSKNVLDGNFIEGMACLGGCIGGAGCLTHGDRNRAAVDNYGKDAADKTITDAVSALK